MRSPAVRRAALDDNLARFDAGFGGVEDGRGIAADQADDVERLGLVHRRVAGLIAQFMRGAEVSEALALLPGLSSSAAPGLFIGCLVSNLITGQPWQDVVFGSLATLAAALLTPTPRTSSRAQ